MRAYVIQMTPNGSGSTVTPEYRSYENMKRYFLCKLRPGVYKVEIHNNWNNRYKSADRVIMYEVEGTK